MKNSPDPEWFHKLEKRLEDYTEEPDAQVWNKIAATIRKDDEPVWVTWMDRAAALLTAILFLWSATQLTKSTAEIKDKVATDISAPLADDASTTLAHSDSPDAGFEIQKLQGREKEKVQSDLEPKVRMTELPADTKNIQQVPEAGKALQSALMSSDQEQQMRSENGIVQLDSLDSLVADTAAPHPPKKKGAILKSAKRWKITAYASVSPSLSFHKLWPFAGDDVVIEGFNARPVFSADRLGVSIQLGIQSRITKRFEAYGGLALYHQSQTVAYRYFSSEQSTATQQEDLDYSLAPALMDKTVEYSMLNVGAEAGVIYFLRGERLGHKIGTGLSYQHGLRKMRGGETYDNGKSQYLSYQLFYRNEYTLNNFVNIFIQPFYRHTFESKEMFDEPFRIKPYHAGLSIGIVCKLR